jgi:membrane-bound metal-dependent hydrolase YbcI (DUF457 family)
MPRGTSRAWSVAMLPPIVLALDRVLEIGQPSRAIEGLLDEVAHAATALVLLAPLFPNANRACALGALAGAVLLDADHVPGELGMQWLTRGTGRPYPHGLISLLTLAGLGLGPGRRWRRFTWPVAAGLTTHLLRDLATGGVPLFWPLSPRTVRLPYPLYAALLGGAALTALRHRNQGR